MKRLHCTWGSDYWPFKNRTKMSGFKWKNTKCTVVTIVPFLVPTLFGKRGIFTHSPLIVGTLSSLFHLISCCLSRFVLLTCLISAYLKPVKYCHFIILFSLKPTVPLTRSQILLAKDTVLPYTKG